MKALLRGLLTAAVVASTSACTSAVQTLAVSIPVDTAACQGEHQGGLILLDRLPGADPNGTDNNNWLVEVNMGSQPTPGYGLSLLSPTLQIEGDTASIALKWIKPPAGKMLPQMVTTPCLVLSIEKGDYTRLQIHDESGEVRYQMALP